MVRSLPISNSRQHSRKARSEKTISKNKTKKMKSVTKKKSDGPQGIVDINMGIADFYVLGTTPLIINRMAEKARQELLFPARKKNRAELDASLKHDPVSEFRSSIYRSFNDSDPTRIVMPSGAFGKALANAGLDVPGASKAQLLRLTTVLDVNVCIYGIPKLFMAVVRMSDIQKTPDIRTRCIIPEWACKVAIKFMQPVLTHRVVANLFGAAGVIAGIGDCRSERGGAFGQFEVVDEDDQRFAAIVKSGGRGPQDQAIANPQPYDAETEELFFWFRNELIVRERIVPSEINDRSGNSQKKLVATK